MWGARTGPMGSTNSCREADLGPRRVGISFRKLACRSDAVDEVLTAVRLNGLDFGAAHDRQALLMKATLAISVPSSSGPSGALSGSQEPNVTCSQQAWRANQSRIWLAAQQGDAADEAFGGMVARMDMPPHARAVSIGRGHRFAADPQCSADLWRRRNEADATRAWRRRASGGSLADRLRRPFEVRRSRRSLRGAPAWLTCPPVVSTAFSYRGRPWVWTSRLDRGTTLGAPERRSLVVASLLTGRRSHAG